jgi:glycerol-3-phosphate dehydrogenase (NAD(P)+)
MYKRVSIIGDGAMGTVLAMLLCEKGIHTRLWGYDPAHLAKMEQASENVKFLPGYPLPETLLYEPADDQILDGADLIVSAVPCQFVRSIWQRLKRHVTQDVPIVSVSKGIENKTLLRPTEIITGVLGKAARLAVLSGPTIADEMARKLPGTACIACDDPGLAERMQYTFTTRWFRIYTNSDVVGVELAGACKNVIALAAGAIDGMRVGDNAKAALLCRGLAEMTRLGVACGAKAETFAGLAGLGDLVTTCISPMGRNRACGERIGQGMTTEQALKATVSVVEGVATCESLVALARSKNIEMPIAETANQVLFQHKTMQEAVIDLMGRDLKSE